MDFLDWVEAMRKKPLADRRRFVGLVTIVFVMVIAAFWVVLFFTGFSDRFTPAPPSNEASAVAEVNLFGTTTPAFPF